jgi:hypothetical protein
MRRYRIIFVKRGALPSAPLSALQPEQTRDSTIAQAESNTEEEMYAACLEHIKLGHTVAVTTPSAEEWSHDQITAVLSERNMLA